MLVYAIIFEKYINLNLAICWNWYFEYMYMCTFLSLYFNVWYNIQWAIKATSELSYYSRFIAHKQSEKFVYGHLYGNYNNFKLAICWRWQFEYSFLGSHSSLQFNIWYDIRWDKIDSFWPDSLFHYLRPFYYFMFTVHYQSE